MIIQTLGSNIVLKNNELNIQPKKTFEILKKYWEKIKIDCARLEPIESSIIAIKKAPYGAKIQKWSGRPGSNRRPSPWQGDVLAN